MNYFQPFSLSTDETIVAAWDSQVAQAAETPWLEHTLLARCGELFPRFAECYAQLRALPRGARRALQRQLARSQELAACLPEWGRGAAGVMLQRKLARSLAGAALLLALGQGVAQAGTINVTAKTPPGVNPDGKCSFIEAIVNANHGYDYYSDCSGATIGPNTITLPKGTQSLTVVDNSTYGATGLPVIASSITIQGNSSKIIRSSSAPSFRVFAVGVYSYLTLQNVTVSGGSTGGNGGAILNYGYTTISGSTISKNTATRGGAIFNAAAYPGTPGTLVINDSIITGNLASVDGGGLNSAGYYADVAINSSTFSKNSAGRDGGGIAAFDGGYLLIRDSTISGNKAVRDGGGVFHYGYTTGFFNLVIDNSILSKNSSMYGGGVCDIFGNFHLYNSTIASNKATVSGGGVLHYNSLTPYNFTGNVFLKNKAPYFPNISFTF